MRSIVVEYYRATTTLSKLKLMHSPNRTYNGPQTMEIGMTWKGHKRKGKGKFKGKSYKGKGKGYKDKSKGNVKGKGKDTGKGDGEGD